jgi:hypothetical protein
MISAHCVQKMGMDVRQASETLIALCEADWICFNGTRDYIDHWMVSELGHRLLATPLVPRFPREEGAPHCGRSD